MNHFSSNPRHVYENRKRMVIKLLTRTWIVYGDLDFTCFCLRSNEVAPANSALYQPNALASVAAGPMKQVLSNMIAQARGIETSVALIRLSSHAEYRHHEVVTALKDASALRAGRDRSPKLTSRIAAPYLMLKLICMREAATAIMVWNRY